MCPHGAENRRGRLSAFICKALDEQGKISFVVFDRDDMSVHEYDISQITQKIVGREIYNAKLENSVVKITDSKRALAKLTPEENKRSSAFYIIEEYRSSLGSVMYAAVSNTGELFEFSANAAADFLSGKKLINGYINKSGIHVINIPTFTTALHKSLEHTSVH